MAEKNIAQRSKSLAELFAIPRTWNRASYAKNIAGCGVEPTSMDACSFCLAGALQCIYPGNSWVRDKLIDTIGQIPPWNDHPLRTQDEVHELCVRLRI